MSATFVSQLRTGGSLRVGDPGADALTIRVEAAELWDAVRVIVAPATSVADVKQRVLALFFPAEEYADDFVLKLHGWEVLDERGSLADAGVVNGSILLLAHRRRRPVR